MPFMLQGSQCIQAEAGLQLNLHGCLQSSSAHPDSHLHHEFLLQNISSQNQLHETIHVRLCF